MFNSFLNWLDQELPDPKLIDGSLVKTGWRAKAHLRRREQAPVPQYKLTRKEDWVSIVNSFNINHCDDPVYDYYYCGDWVENLTPLALGWETDVLFLTSTVDETETVLGFSQISICRANNLIKNIAVCIFEEHREHGHGTIFLGLLIKYLFHTRGFRKGYISVLAENNHMKHIIERTGRCSFIGRRTKHTLRRTGEYSDSLLYEIFTDC